MITDVPEWRNWQTQETQNLPPVTRRVGSIPSSGTNRFREKRAQPWAVGVEECLRSDHDGKTIDIPIEALAQLSLSVDRCSAQQLVARGECGERLLGRFQC
jgi:hypothetical protein